MKSYWYGSLRKVLKYCSEDGTWEWSTLCVKAVPVLCKQKTENELKACVIQSTDLFLLKTYAFLPQMEPLYQFRHVLKYFFFVPMTCCRAHTLGLKEQGESCCGWWWFGGGGVGWWVSNKDHESKKVRRGRESRWGKTWQSMRVEVGRGDRWATWRKKKNGMA